MTPIIDFILRDAELMEAGWSIETSGIANARGLVQAIAEAAVYYIPEAETHTTAAREAAPEIYRTNKAFITPWSVVWIEYRAYSPPDDAYQGNSAFLFCNTKEGVCVWTTSLLADGRTLIKPILTMLIPHSEFGRADVVIGQPTRVRASDFLQPAKVGPVFDFIRELVIFVQTSRGEELVPPTADEQARLRQIVGAGQELPACHVLRAPDEIISQSSVSARAAKVMGEAASKAVN